MKNISPTMQEILSEYEKHEPAMCWSDEFQSYDGIVSYFDLEEKTLRVRFKWIVIGRKILSHHAMIFKNPTIINKGDFLEMKHDGGDNVIITNLASYKLSANITRTDCEKIERIRLELEAKSNHH